MKKNITFIRYLAIGLIALAVSIFLSGKISSRISLSLNDSPLKYAHSISSVSVKPHKIVGIGIDDRSLDKIQQRWPWKRSLYAELVTILNKEGVDTIGIDLSFIGESENKEEDRLFVEALKEAKSRVVLAYYFDPKERSPVLPEAGFINAAYSMGMLNTPTDADGKVRRLRAYITSKGRTYYSLSVALSAAFLKKSEQELVSSLPLSGDDRTFYINYLLNPESMTYISCYDVLSDLPGLKALHGEDFLRGSLVLVYPEAAIRHDIHPTPLGKMPGGLLHLYGIANIVSGRTLHQVNTLIIPFLIFSLAAITAALIYGGFFFGAVLTMGVLTLDFLGLVILILNGLRFDFTPVVFFCLLFFVFGQLYRSLYSLAQIIRIKDKATVDPLRGLFTLRYFLYRLDLEAAKIYFGRQQYLIFIRLEALRRLTEDISVGELKDIWKRICLILQKRSSFWSVYSAEEIAGLVAGPEKKIREIASALSAELEMLLRRKSLRSEVKLVYAKLRKGVSGGDLLFMLAQEAKKEGGRIREALPGDMAAMARPAGEKSALVKDVLGTIGEDIEERNSQLLALIDSLSREHARTKETYFQIIASLVNALEARDPYTEGHSERVRDYSLKLAEKLGWPEEEKEKLKKAALLHDLGKIGIPDAILHKKGALDKDEFDLIRKHEIIGVKILEPLKEFKDILPWILYHHERWDGSGYPQGLKGEAIPRAAQIISLADVFDALTTGRDYKKAFPVEEAVREINRVKGAQFDPRLADLFIEIVTTPSK
ncbi:MAG: CHASE2 domain-containing protein [Candidatus Omnitrophica bacterium]|nr:CHASE2 domain-containing protein [Candidatus Omnitrophota bacterium]